MAAKRRSGSAIPAVGLAFLLLHGCAASPPRTPPAPRDPMEMAPVSMILEAIIVDLRPEVRALTVKDVLEHATWTVAVADGVRVFGPGRTEMRQDELAIGDRVRITGTSRIELILKADEVELLGDARRP